MKKILGLSAMIIGLVLVCAGQVRQDAWRQSCIQSCVTREFVDPDMQRQEIVSLEREAARAIQLNNGTFFRRVYSDDFTGTLSHGQQIDRGQWLAVIESPSAKFESFIASDIKVHLFQDTAVATCLWSARSIVKGQRISSQLRTIHVYVNSPRGWHTVSGQITNLPPAVQQPL